ncbi:MAG TPA: NAD-dependent malic enzyme, partial [Rubrobacteraceae bacterium]|nr:NAD-dependent malic enzyme [Rubrobacteraceae bacterium]
METTPSASYSLTLRVELPHQAGSLGRVLTTVGDRGGTVGAGDIVRMGGERSIRDITVNARDSDQGQEIADAIDDLPDVRV